MNSSAINGSFKVLRRVLKARGMTYADLAEQLDVSEQTIKRLFVERDCKLSRLESICHLLDLSISEVLDIAERNDDPPLVLSKEVEQTLADTPSLFYFFMLLRDEMLLADIGLVYDLDENDLYLYTRDLERLNLLERGTNGNIILNTKSPVHFSKTGPLQQLHADINLKFIRRSINDSIINPTAYITLSRRMRPETAEQIQEDVSAILSRISKLARQDRLSSSANELTAFKWSIASGTAAFATLFDISAHPKKKSLHHEN